MSGPPDSPPPEHSGETPPSGPAAVSLASLRDFFRHLPPDTGAHLHRRRPSRPADHIHRIAEALRTCSAMPVIPVTQPVHPAPDTIYIMPPASHFAIIGGRIEILELDPVSGQGSDHSAGVLLFRSGRGSPLP